MQMIVDFIARNWKTIRVLLLGLFCGAILGAVFLQEGGRPLWDNPTATSAPAATSTAMPTYTALPPLPTYTALPSHTPLPTHTGLPTYTPLPTATPTHTATATATSTNSPTSTATPSNTTTFTPYPTYTALPSHTPLPTHTAWPTYTPFPTATPTLTPIPPRTILSGIRAQANLITMQMELALVNMEVRNPASRACAYSAKHVAKGVIEAGIDLSAIDENSVDYHILGNSYTLRAPAPVLSSCRIEHFGQYEQRGGGTAICFHNNWSEMSDIGRHLSMKALVQDALERGILQKAQRQASYVLEDLVRELTGRSVHIEFAEMPEEPLIPHSCQLSPPDGWEQDYEGGWKRSG